MGRLGEKARGRLGVRGLEQPVFWFGNRIHQAQKFGRIFHRALDHHQLQCDRI